jgi:hypothetical protein
MDASAGVTAMLTRALTVTLADPVIPDKVAAIAVVPFKRL